MESSQEEVNSVWWNEGEVIGRAECFAAGAGRAFRVEREDEGFGGHLGKSGHAISISHCLLVKDPF
jgi:hypothetical protein